MPARNFDINLTFAGGLNLEQPGGIVVADPSNIMIPYLTKASNVLYEEGSRVRSIGGALPAVDAATASDPDIVAILPVAAGDGSTTSSVLAISSSKLTLYSHTNKVLPYGNLIKGSEAQIEVIPEDAVWSATEFEGHVIITNDDASYNPMLLKSPTADPALDLWDGAQPDMAFTTVYANRLWGAGDPANPSRLYYSDLNDPTTGYSSNFIDVDPYGGSKITGLASHRGRLFIFKGPNDGSTYILSGRTPSTFALDLFSDDVGAASHNGICKMSNDIVFVDTNGAIRTLSTTEQFGDFTEGELTAPIRKWLEESVDKAQLRRASVYNDSSTGRLWAKIPTGGESTGNQLMALDYKEGIKISFIDYIKSANLITATNASGTKNGTLVLATSGPTILALDVVGYERVQLEKNATATTYIQEFHAPTIKFVSAFSSNTIEKVCVEMSSKYAKPDGTEVLVDCEDLFDPTTSLQMVWQRDLSTVEEISLNQSYGSRLAVDCIQFPNAVTLPAEGAFILDNSRLDGPQDVEAYAEMETSDFRRIMLGFRKETLDVGMEVIGATFKVTVEDSNSSENLF